MFLGAYFSFMFGMKRDQYMNLFEAIVVMLWVLLLLVMGITFLAITVKEFPSVHCTFT